MSHHDLKVDEYLDLKSNGISQLRKELAADQLKLGMAYFNAYHVEDNCSTAFKWIKLSAEQGNMEAQFRLAELYSLGQGISQSHKDAYKWYTKAAIQGYKKASIRIHNLYQEDIKMHCRGKLDSKEELRVKVLYDEERSLYDIFDGHLGDDQDDIYDEKMPEYHYRELNEQRLEDHKLVLNHAINYYTGEFRKYKSSNRENAEIQQNLGFLYQHGYGVKKYDKWAIEYYTKAAECGFVDSQYQLGCLYQKNTSIKFNYKKAFHWYNLSTKGGNIAAQNFLAYFYEKGLGTDIDYQKALYWYTKSAESGHSRAQLTLGKWYRKGDYVDRNCETAFKWYTLSARQGSGVAQNCLAQLYQTGKVSNSYHEEYVSEYCKEGSMKGRLCSKLQKDILGIHDQEIVEKMKKLAKHALIGDGNAMYQIGLNYCDGNDFDEDKHVGFKWIKNAAEAGHTEAIFKVTRMYEEGDTIQQDFHKTAIWTKKVTKQKNDIAQCNLGILYDEGRGVRNDPLEASKWFTLSASQGNCEAQYQLGRLKQRGRGMRKNKIEALELFNLSAKQGNINGCYKVGMNYFKNNHFGYDPRSYKLLEYSASRGSEHAQFKLWHFNSIENNKTAANYYFDMLSSSRNRYVINRLLKTAEYGEAYVEYKRCFKLLERASYLEISSAKNILQTPFGDHSNLSGDYLLDMFILVSEIRLSSMEYNIGSIYEYQASGETNDSKQLNSYTKAIHWYNVAAEKGDSRAQVRLGIICEEGKGVLVDFTEAINYYTLSCEKENKDARYRLACMYLDGRGISQDLEKAYKLYSQASDMGHIEARKALMLSYNILDEDSPEYKYYQQQVVQINKDNQIKMLELMARSGLVAIQYQLGTFYEKKDDLKAMDWFTLAAQGGMTDACYKLGVLYEEGRGSEKEYAKAISYYEKAISSEHENAMYRLAQMHLYGKGTETNYKKAYKLYSRAAELGHISSCNTLGANFPVDKDLSIVHSESKDSRYSFDTTSNEFKHSLLMFQYVAKEGDVELQYKLGVIYESILDTPNYREAAKWFSLATESSHREATYRLGLLYDTGSGVIQHYQKAIDLYSQAHKLGSYDALYKLGNVYHHGIGTDLDLEKAVQYYTESANNGHRKSQHILGKLYEQGIRVKKDTLKSLRWLTTAYLEGYEPARPDLYTMYDDIPYEGFFFARLSTLLFSVSERILSMADENYENIYGDEYNEVHGYMVYQLGIQYLYGNGVPQDYEKAAGYLNLSFRRFYCDQASEIKNLIYTGDRGLFYEFLKLQETNFDTLTPIERYNLAMTYYNGVSTTLKHKTVSLEPLNNTDNSTDPGDTYSKQDIILEIDYQKARYYFEKATGDRYEYRRVQEKLAEMYIYGHGVDKNIEKAIEYYARASTTTNEYAFEIALIYHFNINFCDYSKAVEWYKRAGEYKSAAALNILGILYKVGHCVNQEYKTAIQYFIEASKYANSYNYNDSNGCCACYNLGLMYYHGQGVKQNHTEAFAYFTKALEKKHKKAQIYLANMYLNGYGTEKNMANAKYCCSKAIQASSKNDSIAIVDSSKFDRYPEAIKWFKKVEEGDPIISLDDIEAMISSATHTTKEPKESFKTLIQSTKTSERKSLYSLGKMYYDGDGVRKNYSVAFDFFIEAAKETNYDAYMMLAEMYQYGYGVDEDFEKAVEWYTKVDGDRKAKALYSIGDMYYEEYKMDDSHQNLEQALRFYKESADIGGVDASYTLGKMYYCGRDVDQNFEEAHDFFLIAANENHLDAQLMLAKMYKHGHGVDKDIEKVIEWYTEASKNKRSWYSFEIDETSHYAFEIANLYDTDKDFRDSEKAIEWYKKVEGNKKAVALNNIGNLYRDGKGIDQDFKYAHRFYKEAAELGSINASYALGVMYYHGQGVNRDYKKSYGFLKSSADKNHQEAQSMLAKMPTNGYDVDIDIEKLVQWYTKASNNDPNRYAYLNGTDKLVSDSKKAIEWYKMTENFHNGIVLNSIATSQHGGRVIFIDFKKPYCFYEKAAEIGSINAGYMLGLMHYYGQGVDQDYEKSYTFLKSVADKNHQEAQLLLVQMYTYGYGVDKNIEKVVEYYIKASKDEPNRYAWEIACLYGTDKDFYNPIKAIEWCKKVEGNQKAFALYYIGILYHQGRGITHDFKQALHYYRKSAARGYGDALIALGDAYCFGKGASQDYKKACIFFKKAAYKKNALAQERVAMLYTHGQGVNKNIHKAIKWYTKAANNGSDYSTVALGMVYHSSIEVQDFTKAFEWYQKVQENDYKSYALRVIGLLYEYGDGVDQNYTKSVDYYQQSIDLENKGGYYNLALMYYHGKGVSQDYKECFDLLNEAVKKEFDDQSTYVFVRIANKSTTDTTIKNRIYSLEDETTLYGEIYYQLGIMHKNGQGTDQNGEEARICFSKAIEYGNEQAKDQIYY